MRLALLGFGAVGRALARLLLDLGDRVPFTVTAIVTRSHGWIAEPGGVDLARALSESPGPSRGPAPAIGDLDADVLVELTTLDARTGEPALTHVRAALERGMHVVTANKGPIAIAYRELDALARARGRALLFEATVADCLPVFDLRRAALPLAEIRSLRGIVSSTNNYVLSAASRGVPFADALAEAQRLGIAEADPRNDLEGWDASAKAAILANVLMGADIRPAEVARTPIDERAARDAEKAAAEGDRVRPVVEVRRDGGGVSAAFGPLRLAPLDPLFAVDGFSMGLELDTDLAGTVVVQLHDPHVEQVAYAVLADLLALPGR